MQSGILIFLRFSMCISLERDHHSRGIQIELNEEQHIHLSSVDEKDVGGVVEHLDELKEFSS